MSTVLAAGPASAVRVAIADDEVLVRRSLRAILGSQPGLVVTGEAADGDGAAELAIRQRPDVLLLDIRMPGSDGLTALRRIRDARLLGDAGTRAVVLTTFDLDDYIDQAFRLGASGFLLKTSPYEELVTAVRAVAAGDALLAPRVARWLIDRYRSQPAADVEAARCLDVLTDRERHVLAVLAEGRSNAEIAACLHLSVHTVKSHVSSLLTKLGLRDRVQAVALAHRARLTPLECQ